MFNPKKLPHNLEAEASVLGGIIADHDRLDLAEEYLCENDFYLQKNRVIFKNMVAMRNHQEVIDVLTLSERLKRQKVFNEIGGVTYLTDLVASVPLPSNYEGYCRIVHDNAVLRKLVETSASILNDCYGEYDQVTDLIDAAESKIFKVSQGRVTNDFSPAKDLLKETVENIRDCCENKGRITGVASGFKKLDACTSGFQRSDLIFLAARPSMGKTALALNIASHAALDENKTVAVFSLEMSKKQLMKRLLCSEAGVDMDKVRKGEVDDTE